MIPAVRTFPAPDKDNDAPSHLRQTVVGWSVVVVVVGV